MEFKNYLNFFMWAFNLKNSDVAKHLYVDPSLISKWRAGRRIPKDNTIYQIAEVLVSLCDTDAMRLKLCSFLSITYSADLFLKNRDRVIRILYEYLNPQHGSGDGEDAPPTGLPMPDAGPGRDGAQVFLGEDGYRRCVLALLNEAIQRGSPFTACLLTTDSVDWILKDAAFLKEWEQTIRRCEVAMATFRLVYHQSHNAVKGRDYVRAWLPMKYLSNFQTYNLAIRQDTHRMFNHTMLVIPHVGACFGVNLNHSKNRYMYLLHNEDALQKLEHDFNFLLTRCIRTTERQSMDYAQLSALFHLNSSLAQCRDVEMYTGHLPTFALPADTLRRMLERAGAPQEKVTAYLAAHRQLQETAGAYFRQGFNFELLAFIPPKLALSGLAGSVLPHSQMNFGRQLIYTKEDAVSHLDAVLELLATVQPFHMYVVEQPLYPTDVFIGYSGLLLEYACNGRPEVLISYQHHYLNDVLSYISATIREEHHEKYSRRNSIRRLQKLRGDPS